MGPPRVDERVLEEPERWVQSCCVLCTNGCTMEIGVRESRKVGVRGIATDRVNHRRLGPKGLHRWEANASPDRLTRPLLRTGGKFDGPFRAASWDEAMAWVVQRCKEVRDQHTSGAIGFYNTRQLFIEDYYTLSTIAQARLGTAHIDGNTRLCTATALRETFGQDGQPSHERGIHGPRSFSLVLLFTARGRAVNVTMRNSRYRGDRGSRQAVSLSERLPPDVVAKRPGCDSRIAAGLPACDGDPGRYWRVHDRAAYPHVFPDDG